VRFLFASASYSLSSRVGGTSVTRAWKRRPLGVARRSQAR